MIKYNKENRRFSICYLNKLWDIEKKDNHLNDPTALIFDIYAANFTNDWFYEGDHNRIFLSNDFMTWLT